MQNVGAVVVALLVVACQRQPSSRATEGASSTGASATTASAPIASAEATAPAPFASVEAIASASTPGVNVTSPAKRQRCHDAARACAKALLAGDNDKIVECMPSQALALAGGREATIADMIKGRAQMSREGVSFLAADVQAPHDIVASGGQLFAVLPQRVTMNVPKGRLAQDSFLLGVSADDGMSWKFVDGASLTQKNIGRLFPNFPSTLVLPVVQEPRALVRH